MKIETIIERAGGTSALAQKLGIHRASVWGWKRIPASRVLDIERIIGIPREELREDLYRPREQDTRLCDLDESHQAGE